MSGAKASSRSVKPKARAKKPRIAKKQTEEAQKAVTLKKPEKSFKELMALRAQINRRRPRFVRQESWRYARLKESWRMPRGIDSKMRRQEKGWPQLVKVGYRGPKAVRGLHPSGLRDVLVRNLGELERLNPQTDAARFASTLGRRSKMALFAKAKEMGIRVLNPVGLSRVEKRQEE